MAPHKLKNRGKICTNPGLWISLLTLALTACVHRSPRLAPPSGREAQHRLIESRYAYLPILGKGQATVEMMVTYFKHHNRALPDAVVREMAQLYQVQAAMEGVNADIAFCQMCHETDFLRFGGQVKADQNNFAGIGAHGPKHSGARFDSKSDGVQAHIQLLKVGASKQPLQYPQVGKARYLLPPGSAPRLKDLTRTWAADIHYDAKLSRHLTLLYRCRPQ